MSKQAKQEAQEPAQPLKFVTASELKALVIPPPDWLVEGWIMRGLVHAIVAQSGTGKSWLALHLLRLFAAGGMFAGKHKVKRLKAAYIDFEDTVSLLKNRWLLLEQGMGALPDDAIEPLLISDIGAIDIIGDAQRGPSIWRERIRASCAGLDVLIIDSLSKTHAFDENSADMKIVLDAFIDIARTTQCTILLIHHAGWTASGMSKVKHGRGSSTIRDSVQSEVFMSRSDNGPNIEITLQKCKGALSGNHVVLTSMQIRQLSEGGIELTFEDVGTTTPGQSRRQTIYNLLKEKPMGYVELVEATRAATGNGKSMVEDEIKKMRDDLLIIQLKERGPYQLP